MAHAITRTRPFRSTGSKGLVDDNAGSETTSPRINWLLRQ